MMTCCRKRVMPQRALCRSRYSGEAVVPD